MMLYHNSSCKPPEPDTTSDAKFCRMLEESLSHSLHRPCRDVPSVYTAGQTEGRMTNLRSQGCEPPSWSAGNSRLRSEALGSTN
jgi:hypothetical protein